MKMMRLNVLLLLGSILLFSSFNASKPINGNSTIVSKEEIIFTEGSWSKALKMAEAEGKYIFVDAYATWCGPCKKMKATSFKDKKVAAFFNKNFINLAIDMEKGEGPALADQWGVEVFPTLYIFDAKGNLVLATEGFMNANQLINFAKKAVAIKK